MIGNQTLIVVAAIFEKQGTYLACRRASEKTSGGKWEFPGGKVEINELPEKALAREIYEELGVAITVGEMLNRSQTYVGGRMVDLACYYVDPIHEYPTSSSDHDQLTWVSPELLSSLDWALPDLPAVNQLMQLNRK